MMCKEKKKTRRELTGRKLKHDGSTVCTCRCIENIKAQPFIINSSSWKMKCVTHLK